MATAFELTSRGYGDLCSTVCHKSAENVAKRQSAQQNYICSNCDTDDSTIYHQCVTCSTNSGSTAIYCHHCSYQYHKPTKYSTHEINIVKHPFIKQLSEDQAHGYGYCKLCYGRDGYIQLATLHCETCDVNICLQCDIVQHQYNDTVEHCRVYISEQQTIEIIDLTIQQYTFQLQYSIDLSSYAGIVWDGSLFLGLYIEYMNTQQPNFLYNKNVIELGSGCAAVPSLTSYILGAKHTIATDMNDSALQLLHNTIHTMQQQYGNNLPCGSIETQTYKFGDTTDVFNNIQFDYIFGSFLLYIPETFDSLAYTIHKLSNTNTVTYFSSHERQREPQFIALCSKYDLNVERIDVKQFIDEQLHNNNTNIHALEQMSSYNKMREISLLKITLKPST